MVAVTECPSRSLGALDTSGDVNEASHSSSLRREQRFLEFILKAKLEARGVEPLSSSLSAQTSTRLSGDKF